MGRQSRWEKFLEAEEKDFMDEEDRWGKAMREEENEKERRRQEEWMAE